ncbi:MAG: MBL fold metallo-hydrolase [Acidimicrobiales bacterium]
MFSRSRVCVALALALVASLVGATGRLAADSGRDPAPLIDKMAVAVGGDQRLDQIETVVISATGTRWVLDEGVRAGDGAGVPGDYELQAAFDDPGDRLRLDYDINSSRFGPRQISELIGPSGGYLIGQNSVVAPPGVAPMQTDRLLSITTHQLLMNPQILVHQLATGVLSATLDRSVRLGGVRHDILLVERDGASPLKVIVNWRTGLIKRIETMESDPLRRDVKLVVRYGLWHRFEGDLRVPTRVTVTYAGQLIQRETRQSVTVNGELAEDLFEAPPGVTPVFDAALVSRGVNSHQHLQSFAALGFPLDGLQLNVVGTELAPGVHWLSGGTHHSLLIEQQDGLVLVDAPLNEYRAQALLDYIGANFPGTPITHLAQSHHHVDHAAGARTILAEGADLVVHRSASQFWFRIMRADSTVVPDVPPFTRIRSRIHTVPDGGVAIVGSGPNAVELHSFEQGHADDLVMAVAGGVAFIVDFYNPFPGAPLPPEGQVILDVIADRNLDVDIISGGHGAFVNVADFEN